MIVVSFIGSLELMKERIKLKGYFYHHEKIQIDGNVYQLPHDLFPWRIHLATVTFGMGLWVNKASVQSYILVLLIIQHTIGKLDEEDGMANLP